MPTGIEGGSVIDVDLSGYIEPQVVGAGVDEDGNEFIDSEALSQTYTLAVRSMSERAVETKRGPATIVETFLALVDSGLENPKMVKYDLWLPRTSDTSEQINAAKGKIRRFKAALGADPDEAGLDKVELVGAQLQATLKLIRDEVYGNKNEIKRILA